MAGCVVDPLEERLKELSWEASRNGTDLTAEYYEQAERLKELKLEQKQTQNTLKNLNNRSAYPEDNTCGAGEHRRKIERLSHLSDSRIGVFPG